MDKDIDYVITELEVAIQNPNFSHGQYIGLIFIDMAPAFPKVHSTLESIEQHLVNTDMQILAHNTTVHQITKDTDITGLEITKH